MCENRLQLNWKRPHFHSFRGLSHCSRVQCLAVCVSSISTFCLITCLHGSWIKTIKWPNSRNWRRETENAGRASRFASGKGCSWLRNLLFPPNGWKSDTIPEKLHTFFSFSSFKYWSQSLQKPRLPLWVMTSLQVWCFLSFPLSQSLFLHMWLPLFFHSFLHFKP